MVIYINDSIDFIISCGTLYNENKYLFVIIPPTPSLRN